jgi:DNA-binding HxlR family transcriptional regulator
VHPRPAVPAPAPPAALGECALALLARRWTVPLLLELHDARMRPHELERRLPAISHALLMRRLAELARSGTARHDRIRGVPPRAYYTLTRAGEELLTIVERAARWEEDAGLPDAAVPGTRALRLLADARTIAILRELAVSPCGPRELGRRLPQLTHAPLVRRVCALAADGLLARVDRGGGVRYAPTEHARRLAGPLVLAMGWERARALPGTAAPPSDLLGALRLLAPLARPHGELRGTCRLCVDAPGEREGGLCLRVEQGRLAVAPLRVAGGRHALARAPLDAWLRVLLGASPAVTAAVVDPRLACAVVDSLTALLAARRLGSLYQLLKTA